MSSDGPAGTARPGRGVGRLKRRPQFLAVAGTHRKFVAPGVIVQVRRHDDRQRPDAGEPALRVGYTASKKVGNAVARNRARRRLRAAVQALMPRHVRAGHDLVLIARSETVSRPWPELMVDLERALRRLNVWQDDPAGAPARPVPPPPVAAAPADVCGAPAG